jgi:hypothetical protein
MAVFSRRSRQLLLGLILCLISTLHPVAQEGAKRATSGESAVLTSNTAPVLSYITPSAVAVGSRSFILSLSGANFLSTSNPAEDADLRRLSLRFLDLNNPSNVADVRSVYRQTHSPELQFAIEQAFLEVSDELYQSLHPCSGPAASIIQLAPEHGCVQPPDNQVTFLKRFYSTRAFNQRGAVVITGRMVLKNIKSGQRFEIKNAKGMGGHYGVLDGLLLFRLNQLSDFPRAYTP